MHGRTSARRRWRRSAAAALGVVPVLLAACEETPGEAAQHAHDAPPPAVTVAMVREQEVNEPFEFIGRAEARQTVDLRARVEGFLQDRRFEEGEDVETGQVLLIIDPGRYEAQLASARARLSRAEATLRDTERDLARTRTLHARGTVADAALDDAIAAYETAEAEVEAAKAGVRAAEIDLEDTQLVAPIDGRIGRALVSMGNLVGPEFGPLARIVSLDPIRAVFSVSEALLVSLKLAMGDNLERDARELFVPRIRLPNGQMYRHEGRIEFVAPEVDAETGTVAVRALFPNENALILPGQFLAVIVRQKEGERRPVVPQLAVQEDRDGRYVLVVDDQNRVAQRRIVTGARIDQGWAVDEGLEPDELVIVGGVRKVRPGMVVQTIMEGRPAEAPGA
jgi:membrane fusion protein, multidrug efflux system